MRFYLLIVVLAVLSPILAAPMPGKDKDGGRKPGTNSGGPKYKGKGKEAAPDQPAVAAKVPLAANPGDIVLAKPKDYIGADSGSGSSKNRIHPAIVLEHDQATHIVKLAPIGHEHPGGVNTMAGSALGLPETPHKTADPSLVSLGRPKEVHQNDLKALKTDNLKEGTTPMPGNIGAPHLQHLKEQIAINNPPPPASEKGEKKKKGSSSGKDKRELAYDLEERYFLESLFDDEW